MSYSDAKLEQVAQDIRDFAFERFQNEKPVTLSRFCIMFGVNRSTIYTWQEREPIKSALEFLMECQRTDLVEGGLENRYNNKTSTLMLQSNHGFTDRSTWQGNNEKPLEVNYKHDPAKAAEEIIKAHGMMRTGDAAVDIEVE